MFFFTFYTCFFWHLDLLLLKNLEKRIRGSGSKFDQLIYGLNNFCLGKVNYIFFVMMSDAGVDEKQDNSPILNTTKSSP